LGLIFSFLLFVLTPAAVAAFYLWQVAQDQYASTTAFTVRQADTQPASEFFGGLTQLGGGSASADADVLYEFIQSQHLVARIDEKLDLKAIYSKAWPEDPVFAFNPDGTIEDLLSYWSRVVKVSYDAATGLIELQVLAFSPEDAKSVSEAIVAESTATINALSAVAREDATRYARADLKLAEDNLTAARQALTRFRSDTQIVDPDADLQVQMGLLSALNQQLTDALITLDLLRDGAHSGDPRVSQAERRIEVIEQRIADERKKFGVGGVAAGDADYATVVAEFERLASDREFAEQAHVAARTAYEGAVAEAQRQSRYLATYISPTLAQKAQYPSRILLFGLVTVFLFMIWAVMTLVYYSLRDRR
jgi:capsular polysaccharide transport system permease protein